MRNNLDAAYTTNWISNKDNTEDYKGLEKVKQQEKEAVLTGKRWHRLPGGKTIVFR